MSADVVAVVSAFSPGLRLGATVVGARAAGASRVIVVDDGTPATDLPAQEVLTRVGDVPGVRVLRSAVNSGIAAALNLGIGAALDEATGADPMILTLDQDTVLAEGDVATLVGTLDHARAAGLPVAAVGPEFMGPARFSIVTTAAGFLVLRDPIQSGLLVPASTFARVGPLREDLFIDAVDTDFALRCEREGLVVVAAPGLELEHALGQARPVTIAGRHVRIAGRQRSFAQHAPWRTYYMARNGMYLHREFGGTPAVRAKRRTDALSFALGVVYGPARWRQVLAVAAGTLDGARGRMGRISPSRSDLVTPRRAR